MSVLARRKLPGRLGKPDYAVHAGRILIGYVELKAPGIGATTSRFTGRNAEQWKRFSAIPNLIYSDGNDWALYRYGEQVGRTAQLSGNVETDGKDAVSPEDVRPLFGVLTDFLSWQPLIPQTTKGEIDLKGLAALLAPLCRMLREDVTDALRDTRSPLVQLAKDWRQLLFPDADNEQFADAYAQTVTFALLLARSEGAEPLELGNAESSLACGTHAALPRPPGPDRPECSGGNLCLSDPAYSRHWGRSSQGPYRAEGAMALFLRGLPRGVRREAAQGRGRVLHTRGGCPGAGPADR